MIIEGYFWSVLHKKRMLWVYILIGRLTINHLFPEPKIFKLSATCRWHFFFFLKVFSSNIGGCATFLVRQSEKESRKSDSNQKFTISFSDWMKYIQKATGFQFSTERWKILATYLKIGPMCFHFFENHHLRRLKDSMFLSHISVIIKLGFSPIFSDFLAENWENSHIFRLGKG